MNSELKKVRTIVLKILDEKNVATIHDFLEATGLADEPVNRRYLQRILQKLIEEKVLVAQGKARSRSYVLADSSFENEESSLTDTFKGISLSKASLKLLRYLEQPVGLRKPVGYNPDFLRKYLPNQSSYLSAEQKKKLLFTLGKVENKLEPAGTYARHILNRLLIELSWNSSRLEGNTYSLLETKRLLELGESAEGKDFTEAQMILNHKQAIEYMVDYFGENAVINGYAVCNIHALLSENLLGDSGASGRLRQRMVGISGSTYEPLNNPHVLKECFELFIKKINAIKDPFEQAFFALVQLSYLQAFEDVNKRTARLVANISFVLKNLKPLSFTDVSKEAYALAFLGVYEKNDISLCCDLFIWAYERSAQKYSAVQQSLGEPDSFKLKYRNVIHDVIRTVILKKIKTAVKIKQLVTNHKIPKKDFPRLVEHIEYELLHLHEGNSARFKVSLKEFRDWKVMEFLLH